MTKRSGCALAFFVTALAACGLSVTGVAPNPGGSDASTDGTPPSVDDAGADVDSGVDACSGCSAACPSACANACPAGRVCLQGGGFTCVGDCQQDCAGARDCTACNGSGTKYAICGDSVCSVAASTCPCTRARDCPSEHEVCREGACVRCGYGGADGGTAGLGCACNTCDGVSCDGC